MLCISSKMIKFTVFKFWFECNILDNVVSSAMLAELEQKYNCLGTAKSMTQSKKIYWSTKFYCWSSWTEKQKMPHILGRPNKI